MDNNLFGEFPVVSTEQWEKVIHQDLKGVDYEKRLVWKTIEGINVKPYYRKEDLENMKHLFVNPGEFPFVRGNKKTGNKWCIRQDIQVKDISEANLQAKNALDKGADAVGFICEGKIKNTQDIIKLLDGINLEAHPVHFITGPDAPVFCSHIIEVCKGLKTKYQGSVDFDILSSLTVTGSYYQSEEKDFQMLAETIKAAATTCPDLKVIAVNGFVFQNSGSTIVQEIAYSLAIANEYLAILTDKNISATQAARTLQFNMAVSSNYFLEIAKIRVLRLLWAKISEGYKIAPVDAKAFVHSVTCDWNKTLYDPYVNVLRSTTEGMSAVIGGTDSLTIKPFDSDYHQPNTISDRIARNLQIVLKEEAHFDKITDPAAGSYYIENLTSSLADEAWKLFLKVEKEGGYTASLKKGLIQSDIEASANKRINDIAKRRETILGTNQYPNINELVLKNIDQEVYQKKQPIAASAIVKPLKLMRASLAFEELRLKTEKSGTRPKVFMLTIGSLSMRLARSQFSSNFFACAGFQTIDNNGFKTIDEGIAAAQQVKADIIVLCSSDEEYATLAADLFNKIDKKMILVVAGNPPCTEELKTKGIENFISIKSDLLETLSNYQKMLGIK